MARTRSADIPNYDTYPAEAPDWANEQTSGNWNTQPPGAARGDDRLTHTAEQIGETVGRAVALARDLPGRVEELRRRFTVIRGRAGEQAGGTAERLRGEAEERLGELRDEAQRRWGDAQLRLERLRDTAQQRVSDARMRADRYARENPFRVILGALAAGALLGIALRLWRSRDE